MKRRAAELAQRRAELLARSEMQREELVLQVAQIAARLDRIDTRIAAVRRFLGRPWLLLGAAVAVIALVGPRKLIRIGTRSAGWFGTARRVISVVQRLRPQLQQHLSNSRWAE